MALDKYSPIVRERLEELDPEILANFLTIDDMEEAMIGTTVNVFGNTVGVYERSLCIKALADRYMKGDPDLSEDDAYLSAEEWFSYNTERALPYEKDRAPIIVQGFMRDSAAWASFGK